MPRAKASTVGTPTTGSAQLKPSARAVETPTRRPVNDPGPVPTDTVSISFQPPAASTARSASVSSALVCSGPPFSESPSSVSYRTSSPAVAATAVSSVAVSNPSVASARLLRDPKEKEPHPFALDEPGHLVDTRNVRGDLVDVERALEGPLARSAAAQLGRELDADRVEDVCLVAAEEGPLWRFF